MDNDKKGNLKLRFRVADVEIELEGLESSVLKQFDVLFEKAALTVTKSNASEPDKTESKSVGKVRTSNDEPLCRNLEAKKVFKTELERVLVYAYILSEYRSKKKFTYKDIKDYYKEVERHTKTRGKNLSGTISTHISKDFIASEGTKHTFILEEKGKEAAREIIARGDNG